MYDSTVNKLDLQCHNKWHCKSKLTTMVKSIYLIILLLLCNLSFFAQKIQKLEGEASLGLTVPLCNYHNGEKLVGPELGL